MTRLHFIGGEKGGVGKSVVARILAQYFIDRQMPFLGFDTDKSHGSLLRFYGDFAAPVVIDSYDGLDRIVEAAAEQPDAPHHRRPGGADARVPRPVDGGVRAARHPRRARTCRSPTGT